MMCVWFGGIFNVRGPVENSFPGGLLATFRREIQVGLEIVASVDNTYKPACGHM